MSRRQSVRARIALICAGLFLVTGAILIAITYTLLDNNLPVQTGPSVPPGESKLLAECRGAVDPNLVAKCKLAYQAGAAVGAQLQHDQILASMLVYAGLGLAGLTVLAGGAGWVLAGRALRPLRAITETARRASERNLGERLALTGPRNELRELADTFDGMLDRLDAAFAAQRRFVANASHELRTPLTVMRTAIDVTLAKPHRTPAQLDAMAVEVRQAVTGAEALIDALLTLARSDQGRVGTEFVDLATAAEDALDSTGNQVRDKGIAVESRLSPAETVGDRVLLERMVANLVDNALRHNVSGGWLHISTGPGAFGGVQVTVANSGPVIAPDLAPTLFEPFRRLRDRIESEQGVGLGLSIVRSVVTTHGGQVMATALPAGGLQVAVLLPAARLTRQTDLSTVGLFRLDRGNEKEL